MQRTRVCLALLLAMGCSSLGDVAISQAMQQVYATGKLLNAFLLMGLLCHLSFLVIYLYALKKEDLSFVLPLTAMDYVLVTLIAALAVGEDVSPQRWAGTLLVALGVGITVKS